MENCSKYNALFSLAKSKKALTSNEIEDIDRYKIHDIPADNQEEIFRLLQEVSELKSKMGSQNPEDRRH